MIIDWKVRVSKDHGKKFRSRPAASFSGIIHFFIVLPHLRVRIRDLSSQDTGQVNVRASNRFVLPLGQCLSEHLHHKKPQVSGSGESRKVLSNTSLKQLLNTFHTCVIVIPEHWLFSTEALINIPRSKQ